MLVLRSLKEGRRRFLVLLLLLGGVFYLWQMIAGTTPPDTRMDTGGMQQNIARNLELVKGTTPPEAAGAGVTYPITQHLLGFVKESESLFQTFLLKRDAVIGGRDLDKIDIWADPTLWNYFPPSITCPYPATRLGAVGDGGKWICGIGVIARKSRPCIIYSFGVGGDSSFEDELLSSTNCSVYAFDHTEDGIKLEAAKYPGRVHFDRVGLGVGSGNSLKELMAARGHDWIDILKVDIERAEFRVFQEIFTDFPTGLPFGHLNLELHLTTSSAERTREEEGEEFRRLWIWWSKVEEFGVRAWMGEVNHLWGVGVGVAKPWLVEYAFINVKHVLNALGGGKYFNLINQ